MLSNRYLAEKEPQLLPEAKLDGALSTTNLSPIMKKRRNKSRRVATGNSPDFDKHSETAAEGNIGPYFEKAKRGASSIEQLPESEAQREEGQSSALGVLPAIRTS